MLLLFHASYSLPAFISCRVACLFRARYFASFAAFKMGQILGMVLNCAMPVPYLLTIFFNAVQAHLVFCQFYP